MAAPKFQLSYASIPFVSDTARVVRMDPLLTDEKGAVRPDLPRKHQVECDILDEINRLIPFDDLCDFASPKNYPNRSTSALGYPQPDDDTPSPRLKIGQWFYPTGASRWSVFRGLATSTMVKDMLASTNGNTSATFIMKASIDDVVIDNYTIETHMHMLPPRPLAEHGGGFDGLYLVTLVDNRYFFQYTPVTLRIKQNTTWDELIGDIEDVLGVSISYGIIPFDYRLPEQDSQLWSNNENAAGLLDSIAYSLGFVVVREYSGNLTLLSASESHVRVRENRPRPAVVTRLAGGDMFTSGGDLMVGNLFKAKNAVVPVNVQVNFPKYIEGDDPVPHFLNSRYAPQRPSARYEESLVDNYTVTVPIASGGTSVFSGSSLSGITGISTAVIHSTAKALYSGEAQAESDSPMNASGLRALAMKVAKDYYESIVLSALDEVYPGTFKWTPEGIHDIIWTYSERSRLASTRVMRGPWNQMVREMQHGTPPLSGYTNTPRGVGGPSVALTVRDEQEFGYTGELRSGGLSSGFGLTSGGLFLNVTPTGNIPTHRWRALVDGEVVLAEGQIIIYRGIDGTIQRAHASGVVTQVLPNTTYGTNLLTYGQGFAVRQEEWSSGGISEAHISFQIPPLTSGNGTSGSVCASGMDIDTSYIPLCGSGGSLEVWQRQKFQTIMDGCLSWIKGPWTFYSDMCVVCICSGQMPPADLYWCVLSGSSYSCLALGTTPPTAVGPPHQSPGNCLENCLSLWWCISNGGNPICVESPTEPPGALGVYDSESECMEFCPPPSTPDCPQQTTCEACIHPGTKTPVAWTMYLSQFTGLCSSLQGQWTLVETHDCVWQQVRGNGTAAILKFANGLMVLRLYTTINGSLVLVSQYQKSIGVIDCCVPHDVFRDPGHDQCDRSPSLVNLVPICCDGGIVVAYWWCIDNTPPCILSVTQPPGVVTFGPSIDGEDCLENCMENPPEFECCVSPAPPNTLTATVTNNVGCECVDGSSGDIIAVGDEWSGTIGLCFEQPINVSMRCLSDETGYEVKVDIAGGDCGSTTGWISTPTSLTCDPFDVTFNARLIFENPAPSCCGLEPIASINIHIFE